MMNAMQKPRVTRSGQDVEAIQFLEIGAYRVELHIRSNAYKHQCHAHARVWHPNALKWNLVYSIPWGDMMTAESLYARPEVAPVEAFAADLARLLAGVTEILSPVAVKPATAVVGTS